ncbi:MAG: Cys-rich protein [Leptospiraceae bacterium]|nr:Cys-rich protein [Leptospiraceae bacterium]
MKQAKQMWLGTLVALTLIVGVAAGNQLEANDCQQACTKFVQCVQQNFGQQGSAQQQSAFMTGCMNACNHPQNGAKVLQCYRQSQNQCSQYHSCIQQYMQ